MTIDERTTQILKDYTGEQVLNLVRLTAENQALRAQLADERAKMAILEKYVEAELKKAGFPC